MPTLWEVPAGDGPPLADRVDWTLFEAAGLRVELERSRRELARLHAVAAEVTLELRVVRAERDAALAERDAARVTSGAFAPGRSGQLAC